MQKRISKTELLIWIVGAELFGAVSALVGGNFSGFYDTLTSPPLSPPAWLFPVMWAIIYGLLGASAYIIFRLEGSSSQTTVAAFASQLILNFAWSIVFFRLHFLWIAAIVLVALTVSVGIMLLDFYRKNKLAGLMNILYLFWCMFACYLNIGIAVLN
ncbi:TspO/MBR family protein [Ruminococcus sp. NK3A76]|uniref:TspO/MBR family protein n=1 Tax=Ruminococcus sp. NK3A76 TaxID=877411 RepID=UPI00049104E7|nr:TspO/MBR family protein [Ruminococcus sp. NK3A76]